MKRLFQGLFSNKYRGDPILPAFGLFVVIAFTPLIILPSLIGENVIKFLLWFSLAWLAYSGSVWRLRTGLISMGWVWGTAILLRYIILLTPLSLSNDIYRYLWDGHLLGWGINPYSAPVNSPILDVVATPYRVMVDFNWMASPYLPAAQVYFWLINKLAPQSVIGFRLSAILFDLGAAYLLQGILTRLNLPPKGIIIYLWNPLVVIEFAHSGHIDAWMLFLTMAAFSCYYRGKENLHDRSRLFSAEIWTNLSAVLLAAATLVKGWPILFAPALVPGWKWKGIGFFLVSFFLPLIAFACGAGWGLVGQADGSGLFGALRIYSEQWAFNSGLFILIEWIVGGQLARISGLILPIITALAIGFWSWGQNVVSCTNDLNLLTDDVVKCQRKLFRVFQFPFWLYILLSPTVHPWYITLVLVLLPLFMTAQDGQLLDAKQPGHYRLVWPWVYFTLQQGFTYLAYSGLSAPGSLLWFQIAAYLPFWGLLVWGGRDVFSTWSKSKLVQR